jgi:hypothetical protein
MLSTNRTRILCASGVLALVLAGCGGSRSAKSSVAGVSPPSPAQITAAMEAQPRMAETLTGGTLRRVVIDVKARYAAFISSGKSGPPPPRFPSGTVVVMDKHGIEYRRQESGCYDRYKAAPTSTSLLWSGLLASTVDSHYTTKVSGRTVLYSSKGERMTIDARTHLMRSQAADPPRATGVSRSSAELSYPSSVPELPTPANICQ